MAALDQGVPQLDLGGHLADVAVGSHGVHDVRIDLGREPIGHRQVRRWLPRVEDPHPPLPRERPQLGVVADERVQPAPDLEPALERGAQPAAPFGREPAAHRRDSDQHRRRSQAEALLEIAHDRERASEPQHLLHGLARLGPV